MKPSLDRFQPPAAKEQFGGLETRECSNCDQDFIPEREHQRKCKECEKEESKNE